MEDDILTPAIPVQRWLYESRARPEACYLAYVYACLSRDEAVTYRDPKMKREKEQASKSSALINYRNRTRLPIDQRAGIGRLLSFPFFVFLRSPEGTVLLGLAYFRPR